MILKSLILGVIVFLFDLFIFGYGVIRKQVMGSSPEELKKLKLRLTFVIPIVLFIQLFFSIVLLYAYKFMLTFKVFESGLAGGLSFSFIFFVPMIYILLSNMQWGDRRANERLVPALVSCVVKFSVVGLFLGAFA